MTKSRYRSQMYLINFIFGNIRLEKKKRICYKKKLQCLFKKNQMNQNIGFGILKTNDKNKYRDEPNSKTILAFFHS